MQRSLLLISVSLLFPFLFWGCATSPCHDAATRYQSRYPDADTIEKVLQQELLSPGNPPSKNRIPGAQVVYGNRDRVLYSAVYGRLSSDSPDTPENLVTPDTLFDLASLTKPVVTATGIMLLNERGLLKLNDSISKYLPEYMGTALSDITIEELLRHRSGLADTPEINNTQGASVLARVRAGEDMKAFYLKGIPEFLNPSKRGGFSYSDLGYILLATVIERLSGLPLDRFAEKEIFTPLGMKQSSFLPPPETSTCARAWRRCLVNDNTVYFYLGGTGGSAGAYSTAGDIAIFARMILNRGMLKEAGGSRKQFLKPQSVDAMTSDAAHSENLRGLGWDIDTAYSCAPRGSFPVGSFGHTGYTGTSLWIDPESGLFVVILTNEVDAKKGLINPVRWKIAEIVQRGAGGLPSK